MNDTDPSKSLQFLAIAMTIRGKPSHSIDLICEYVAQLQAQRGFKLEINCAVGNLAICESGFELTSTLIRFGIQLLLDGLCIGNGHGEI